MTSPEDRLRDAVREMSFDDYGAEEKWIEHCKALKHLILNEDPSRFLQWDVIQYTMYVTYGGRVMGELEHLVRDRTKDRGWELALNEHPCGSPVVTLGDLRTSMNIIHMAYHIALFEKYCVPVTAFDSVLDIGGGYGCMCRFLRGIGAKGNYAIFDLPIFLALQRYYLECVGVENVDFVSDASAIPSSDMCIATWSWSEMPLDLRAKIEEKTKDCVAFLIAYQGEFSSVDNIEYFKDLQARWDHVCWIDMEDSGLCAIRWPHRWWSFGRCAVSCPICAAMSGNWPAVWICCSTRVRCP